ncbi:MAG: DeoR/GlpR transcriptional regulator [Nitratireductor sp.]|nr:DeoR/GlpR transcriptional regulator [Nitratireductor sp.]MCC0022056.1 DeoR/GlpR transcriptional regulator [Nitratireductor sp.]
MKPHERQQLIEERIRREGEVTVEVLARDFDVSTETIRRDLAELVETGKAQKIHGGARRPRLMVAEGSFNERQATESPAKIRIGRLLSKAVTPGETLFIDTGSTTLAAAEFLAAIPGLTIVTNSTRLAERLAISGSTAEVFLLGGRFHGDNAETVGPETVTQIATYQADRAVISVAAMSSSIGGWDASHEEAQVARAMIDNSHSLTVLADSTKFGRRAAFKVCEVEAIDLLITDSRANGSDITAIKQRGVEIWQ